MCRDARADIQKQTPVYRAEYTRVIETNQIVKEATYEGN